MESEADYFTNRVAGGVAPAVGSDEYRLMRSQFADRQRADQQGRSVDRWASDRNPYYETIYNRQVEAANADAQQGYSDALKRTKLQHAARGTSGSSQELYNDAELSAAARMRAAQGAMAAQNRVQGIRQNDLAQARQMKLSTMAPSPYLNALYEAMSQKYGTGRVDSGMSQMDMQRLQDIQHFQNNMSQIYGQGIGNAMSGLQTFVGGMGSAGGGTP
jgi:hypothetical protein